VIENVTDVYVQWLFRRYAERLRLLESQLNSYFENGQLRDSANPNPPPLVPATRTITAGGLLTGGGDLTQDRVISLLESINADWTGRHNFLGGDTVGIHDGGGAAMGHSYRYRDKGGA